LIFFIVAIFLRTKADVRFKCAGATRTQATLTAARKKPEIQ
jgi:hypothetical protein